MSWEETLRQVVRKYYRAGPDEAPAWVSNAVAGTSPPVILSNTTCGDRVVVHLEPSGEGSRQPMKLWLDVAGCAICKASAEMAVQAARTLAPQKLEMLAQTVLSGLEHPPDTADAERERSAELAAMPAADFPREDLETMLRLRDVPGRQRCASLPWEAVLQALGSSR